ncbi:C1 family peptidase [Candidatus Zixiibacteriota bacterium]
MTRKLIPVLSLFFIFALLLFTTVNALGDQELAKIQQAIEEQGARWTAADNPIFRLSPEERKLRLGWHPDPPEAKEGLIWTHKGPKPELPEGLDWRDHEGANWVTPIRDQGPCGSCVAFGNTAAFEARLNIYSGSPGQDLDLSEQNIFSCGGGSCSYGWWSGEAARYLRDVGAPLESCLPYEAVDNNCNETCADWEEQSRRISGYGFVGSGPPEVAVQDIKIKLLDGPVVSGFTVMEDFWAYNGGVYQHTYGDVAGGHCICIVGWDDADSCWIVKNSWGPGWGENGYFRIRMGHNEVGIEGSCLWMIPDEVYTAYVDIAEYNVLDHIGNADGVPDASETFDFTVSLTNARTWADLTDVDGWLLPTDPRVQIVGVQSSFNDLPGGGSSTNADDPFVIKMSEKIGVSPLPFSLYVTGSCGEGSPYSTELNFDLPITLPRKGWPVSTVSGTRCSPLMLWSGGGPRRLVAVEDGGYLHVWDEAGQEVDGFPFRAPGGSIWGSVTLGDLNGDGTDDILFGSKNDTLYALNQDGSLLFKRDMGADVLATPVLGDLNEDGNLEIVLGTMDSQLHILTAQGQKYNPFPIILGGSVMADAALADLDDNGTLDVIVGASDGLIYAISAENGESLDGFPVSTGGAIWSAPAIADLNHDGSLEIIVGSDDKRLYVVDSSGLVRFTYFAGQAIKSAPAIADLDNDNRLDVVFASNSGAVYAVNCWGYSLTGWPYHTGKVMLSSPIILDVDGDQFLDVVVQTPGPELLHLRSNGQPFLTLPFETTGLAMSTPVAGDLDNDGDLEIAVGAPDGVHVWNYPTAATVDMPWPMYRGNAQRTGYVEDVTTSRPEDDPAVLSIPGEYALQQNYPNPFNPETTIRYALAQDGPVRLSIYNVLGQEIVSLVDGHRPAGRHTVVWDGVDAGGRDVSSGLYFYRLQAGDFESTRKMVLLR